MKILSRKKRKSFLINSAFDEKGKQFQDNID